MNSNAIIVWNINISCLTMERLSRQRINKGTADVNNTIDQIDVTVRYGTSIQQKQKTSSFEVHMEHFVG